VIARAAVPGSIADTSSNNGDPRGWNWPAMRAAGVVAVIAKATEGTGYANRYYAATRACARGVGMDFAAYHFAHFTDPIVEANFFRSVAGSDAKVLDSETSRDAAWQNRFLAALNQPGYEEMDYGSASTLPRTGIRSLLWPASYGSGPPGFGDMWQDTDRLVVPGCPVQLDGSVWTGSPADYVAFFRGAAPPLPAYQGGNMICTDPATGGSWALAPDGGIDTSDGAPILGSLAGNRWNWQAVGTLDGVTSWKDPSGQWGYKIAVRLNSGTAPDGGVFDYYRFPRDATLKSADAARFEVRRPAASTDDA
jgi:lysozyme